MSPVYRGYFFDEVHVPPPHHDTPSPLSCTGSLPPVEMSPFWRRHDGPHCLSLFLSSPIPTNPAHYVTIFNE